MNKKKVIIIAEAGVNHNGHVDLAKQLIIKASEAGADFVKFQTFKTENLVSKDAEKAEYQKKNIGPSADAKQYSMLKNLELSFDDFIDLNKFAKAHNIAFCSTAFDIESLDFVNSLGISFIKIPSGEVTNLPYLVKAASFGKNVILSTGMCTLPEIKDALQVLYKNGLTYDKVSILHCTTEYPAPFEEINLSVISSFTKEFPNRIGYSDHTVGVEASIAAVALGATIIEKHFTLDRNLEGPDHKASLEPNELTYLINCIRNIESGLGNPEKKPTASEIKNINIARKSIHIKNSIQKGDIIKIENLICKRPGDGISPMKIYELAGRLASKDLPAGYKLKNEDII